MKRYCSSIICYFKLLLLVQFCPSCNTKAHSHTSTPIHMDSFHLVRSFRLILLITTSRFRFYLFIFTMHWSEQLKTHLNDEFFWPLSSWQNIIIFKEILIIIPKGFWFQTWKMKNILLKLYKQIYENTNGSQKRNECFISVPIIQNNTCPLYICFAEKYLADIQ